MNGSEWTERERAARAVLDEYPPAPENGARAHLTWLQRQIDAADDLAAHGGDPDTRQFGSDAALEIRSELRWCLGGDQ